MGLFDKMFGRGAAEAAQQQGAQQRFDELKQKYQTVLTVADNEKIQFQNLHVQDDKLFIRGIAPSEEAKSRFWDEIRRVNPKIDDITGEIQVGEGTKQREQGQTYMVASGDTLSKISKRFYGDANEYMRIFYANRDTLNDPDKLRVGTVLSLPGHENFPDD